jgi:putative CocE/NonD family hydrolase
VRKQRQALIPMSDGVDLAASLYRPDGDGPFPTLVSFYPYRKDDLIGGAYEYVRGYLAERGYASLLVDSRGTGSSDGETAPTFDYDAEGRDGVEVLDWAAQQDWCDGEIAVWGISYGGAMAYAIAAQGSRHLKAICSINASPDVYSEVCFPGGTPSCLNNTLRETVQLARDLAPPTFQDPEGRWERVWRNHLARLERGEISSLEWSQHPDCDAYWQEKIIDVSKIEVPAFVIGGWNDALHDGAMRAYEALPAPKRLLVGPWAHLSPDDTPFEGYDYPLEMCRWFDQWLRGESGQEDDEAVEIFVQGADSWRSLEAWPPQDCASQTLFLAPGRGLDEERPAPEEADDRYEGIASVGAIAGGMWNMFGLPFGYPREQTPDEQRSLTYTGEPLDTDLEIVGCPRLVLHAALESGTELHLTAKLSHVAPDGTSTHVATGWLNAAHRNSHAQSEPMKLGQLEQIDLSFWPTAYRIPAGHRLRVAIACADFPRVWPAPVSPHIRVALGGEHASALVLPAITTPSGTGTEIEVPRPDRSVNRGPWGIDGAPTWRVEEDRITGTWTTTVGSWGKSRPAQGGTITERWGGSASVNDERPDAAHLLGTSSITIEMPNGAHVEVDVQTRNTRDHAWLQARVTLDGREILDRSWTTE